VVSEGPPRADPANAGWSSRAVRADRAFFLAVTKDTLARNYRYGASLPDLLVALGISILATRR
jgi:hypothetical protein